MKRILSIALVLTIVFMSSTAYIANNVDAQVNNTSNSPTTENQLSRTITNAQKKAQSTELVDDLDEIINEYDELSIAASVIDLDNDQPYNAGLTATSFKGASTIKVLTAVYFMHQVESGNVTLSAYIQGVQARTLLKQMLQNSDNSAWATLSTYLGGTNIQTYARSIGVASFNGGDYNTITTNDYVKFLSLLYKGSLINNDHVNELYGYMQDTDNETLIPAALPANATVYHKWGTILGNMHDVAIVEYNGHHLAIVLYTDNEDGTLKLQAQQTAAIHMMMTAILKDLVN